MIRLFRSTVARFLALAIGLSFTALVECAYAEQLAFPGAEGFGAHAKGGRGGAVYIVSTLEDYHPGQHARSAVTRQKSGEVIRPPEPAVKPEPPIPGSLRAGIDAEGPRTIVFSVSGTIDLKGSLVVENPYLTIAGQSAPGGGICLKRHGLNVSGTHDVIIRYLRVRPGDEERLAMDAINVGNSQNVMIDHCSTSWAIDETLSASSAGSNDVTVQWCFITESLHDSYHPKGPHGMGSLLRTNGDVTFHHNLYAHHNARSPRPGTYGEDRSILLDFRNNVIYNWGAVAGYSAADPVRMNYVGNYLKPGPSSRKRETAFQVGGETTVIFAKDNLLIAEDARSAGGWELIADGNDTNRADEPFPTGPIHTESPDTAMRSVLAHGGASLPQRDSADARIVAEFKNGTGTIIDSQTAVGGWPTLESGTAPADSDKDGMPDRWESERGLDAADGTDHSGDRDGDGYTNLEEYLNGLAVEAGA